MVVYAGQGDPRRSMALLWRTPWESAAHTAPGPKPELSIDLVVKAAIEVADADGMAALSMRAVGERLGRTAMSLYTYVAGKNELIDLMYDHAFTEIATDSSPADLAAEAGSDGDDWRAATTAWAVRLWRFYLRHPWSLQVSHARPVLGPNEYALFEALATVLHRAGLLPKEISWAHGSIHHLVRGVVSTAAEARHSFNATGVGENEWWHERSAELEKVCPDFSERFPTLVLMESQGAFVNEDQSKPYLEQEAWETFQFGLEALLDGIQRRLLSEAER